MSINNDDLIDLDELPDVEQPSLVPSNVVSINQNWATRLITTNAKNTFIQGNHANVSVALDYAPEWQDVLAFDEFSRHIIALNPTPWGYTGEWGDIQDTEATIWMQQQGMISVSSKIVATCIVRKAIQNCFHPVRSYLDNLQWDQQKRIDTWLTLYLGVPKTEFSLAIASRFLISAVARIYKPGCKADCCLILEGKQGTKKSTALKIIAGDWFTDDISDLGSKDSIMQLHGNWIIEMGELDAIHKTDVSKIKSFISRTSDKYRPPYARHVLEVMRQCVFTGSTNNADYLRDETGARRFWPIVISQINTTKLLQDRDQLWAEAVHHYKLGLPWWLDHSLEKLAEEEQQYRYNSDIWEDRVMCFVDNFQSVTIDQILQNCLNLREGDWNNGHKKRVSSILTTHDWCRYRVGPKSKRVWKYLRKLKDID